MQRLVAVVMIVACRAEKTRRDDTKDCATFARRVAEQMAIGAERKNPLAPYVRPELVADIAGSLEPMCREKLPAAHVACVAASATAQDADKCPLDLDATVKQGFFDDMNKITLAAIQSSMTFPATEAECSIAGTKMAKQLTAAALEGTKMPDAVAVSRLCEKDTWDAAFVRCFNDRQDTKSCRSQPIVEDGIRDLVRAQQP